MFTKLAEIEKRYNEISEKLSDPQVIADMPTWRKLSKEHADFAETVETYQKYRKKEQEMSDALSLWETETDGEMKELLFAESAECKTALAEHLKELKMLLLPKDKSDEKNCILEIRAGAGGEEAALFAGVLVNMYAHYCAAHRLAVEEIYLNKTELGGVKEGIFSVNGVGADILLKSESGVH